MFPSTHIHTCNACQVSWHGPDRCWSCGEHHPEPHPKPGEFWPYNGNTVTHDQPTTDQPATVSYP